MALCALLGTKSSSKETAAVLPAIPPDGLVVYKRHQQADEYAPIVEYSSARFHSTVINMKTKGGGNFSVLRGQMVYHIDYPAPNADLLRDSDISELKARIVEYEAASKRFKRTAPRLKPWIVKLRQELSMWEQGYGRSGGSWVDRASFVFDKERTRLREEFERKKAKILASKKPREKTDAAPPLWAEDLEAQLAAEQAQFREAVKKRIRDKEIARADEFRKRREEASSRLSKSSGLDKAKGLDKSGSLNGGK